MQILETQGKVGSLSGDQTITLFNIISPRLTTTTKHTHTPPIQHRIAAPNATLIN